MRVPEDAARQQLDRIVDSRAFANAERLRAFLRFVVQETLAGRKDAIKEYSIGREVCGRPAGFDPKADPIVRVDANRLRSRLETYYGTEGLRDEVRIELPKGGYVPVFRHVPADAGASAHNPGSPAAQPSLAVLPFVNLSPPGEHDYFGDSLTEELIHSLARLDGLRVIARSSVFQFKDRSVDARGAGTRLNVGYVVEGSVRIAAERLRITVQLINVQNGWLLWSEKYECQWEGVFTVQDEIAASITDALRIRLTSESGHTLFLHATDDPDAYADYLRGRYYWNQRTPQALAASIRSYEQALARDPRCAPAYAGLADTFVVMALNDQEPTSTLMPRAKAAAHKALELRPGWPEGLASSGCVKSILDWDWEGGGRELEEAARRQPGSVVGRYLYAIVSLQPRGRWTEALDQMQLALRLDPVSPLLLRDLGILHFMRGCFDDAAEAFRQMEDLAPKFRAGLYWRARLAIVMGRFDEAIAALDARQSAGDANTRVLATIGYASALSGDRKRAFAIRDNLTERSLRERVPPLDLATVCLGLGDWESALDFLERACGERAASLYQFGVDPIYDPLRSHPRAEALRRAIGLRPAR